jgi:hypothetical protein
MMWAAIGIGYRSKLVFFPLHEQEDGKTKGYRLNAGRYKRLCLMPKVCAGKWKDKIFMQDNARCHVSKEVTQSLKKKGVAVLDDWPPYSPDLNPIENVWKLMKDEVGKRQPETQEELRSVCQTWWETVPQTVFDKLVRSFVKRLALCKANEGKY